jgi:hypothetical protein
MSMSFYRTKETFSQGCTFTIHQYRRDSKGQKEISKRTTGGIPRWSPTLVLVARFSAYVWQSGRDAQFSLTYGRMYLMSMFHKMIS